MNRMGGRDTRSCFLFSALLGAAALITVGGLLLVAYRSEVGSFIAAVHHEAQKLMTTT